MLDFVKTEFADQWQNFMFLRLKNAVHNKNALNKLTVKRQSLKRPTSVSRLQIRTHEIGNLGFYGW